MAVATYTTDLATINLMTGSHVELTGALEGRITDNDPDNFIAGTDCATSQTRTGGNVSIAHPSNAVTIASGSAAFFWFYHGAMPTVDIFANNGFQAVIGNSSANYNRWTVHGRDTLPKGGWFSVAIDPTTTPTNTQGSPTATTSTFGSRIFMTAAVSKGNPFAIDYSRHGRSIIIDDGEIANPANFTDASTENDLVANKWGLFESTGGGFAQKGLFQIGTVASPAYFVDSNKNILIEDTLHVGVGFNEFEVLNTGTTLDWNGISISKIGLVGKGLFTVTDNATVTITGCTFTDMAQFVYQSNSTITDTVFRRCDLITQGGSTITGNTFTNCTGATSLLSDNIALVTGNTFVSDGSNHAVEITSIGGGSLDWDNQLSGYVAGAAGSPATTSSTGNEALYVNVASGTLTVNVAAGASVPSIRTAGATVNVVAGAVTLTITVQDTAGSVIQGARAYILAGAGGDLTEGTVLISTLTDVNGQVSLTQTYSLDQPITGRVRKSSTSPYYKTGTVVGTISKDAGLDATIIMLSDE